MAFTKGDRSEVEGLLGKLTTTMDALGRSKRDIELVLKLNRHWPYNLRGALGSYAERLGALLDGCSAYETAVVSTLDEALPPEE